MDLVSFIPGITNTASFSPGSTTPPPFNVSHTGLTDGTGPSTASKNVAEVYNRLLLQVAATIQAAGLSVDNNNWTQLAQAVEALVAQGVSAFTSSLVTPPQFDNDSSLATTAFVQRALGNTRGVVNVSSSVALAAADAGNVYYLTGNGLIITLAPTGCAVGSTFTFISDPVYTSTLSLTGASFRPTEVAPGSSFTLRPRSQYTIVWDGSFFRFVNGGSLNTITSYISDAGYIRLDSGLMIQWGVDNTAIGETSRTVLFGWSFPTACRSVSLTGKSDGATITNNNIPQLVSQTTSSFTYFNQGIAETTQPVGVNQGIYYLAIGN